MKTYRGYPTEGDYGHVEVKRSLGSGSPQQSSILVPLKPELGNFTWGTDGADAEVLALTLLFDALDERHLFPQRLAQTRSWRLDGRFVRDFVSRWRYDRPWEITDTEIRTWVHQEEAKQSHTESSNSPTYGARKSTPGTAGRSADTN